MTRLRTALALTLAGFLLVLGGCSEDDPRPKIAPSESAQPTESASASGSPSPGTRARNDAAQNAFVRAYFSQIGKAVQTGDTSLFLGMSSPKCKNCKTLASNISEAFAGDNYVEGGDWTAVRVRRQGVVKGLGTEWSADVRSDRTRFLDGSGELIKVAPPTTQKFAVLVAASEDAWILRDLRLRG